MTILYKNRNLLLTALFTTALLTVWFAPHGHSHDHANPEQCQVCQLGSAVFLDSDASPECNGWLESDGERLLPLEESLPNYTREHPTPSLRAPPVG